MVFGRLHWFDVVITAPDSSGREIPVDWKQRVRAVPTYPSRVWEGRGRFNAECWILGRAGVKVVGLTPTQRETAQFFFDGLFPFVLLIGVSAVTRRTDPVRVAQFYGKMKTPVAEDPDEDGREMERTRRDPARYDHTKLFPGSDWEFARWTKTDAIGFAACCALSGGIVMLFVFLLRLASTS